MIGGFVLLFVARLISTWFGFFYYLLFDLSFYTFVSLS